MFSHLIATDIRFFVSIIASNLPINPLWSYYGRKLSCLCESVLCCYQLKVAVTLAALEVVLALAKST